MSIKSLLKLGFVSLILVVIIALLFWAFIEGRKELAMEKERERPIKTASRVSIKEGEKVITIDKATQIKSGIGVAPLKSISHQGEIKAYGTVLQLQSLIDLYNSYSAAKAQLEKMQASLNASHKGYERLKALHEENRNISDKALQAAEAALRSDEANTHAAQESLRAIEGTARQQWGSVIAGWMFNASPQLNRLIQQQDVLIQITLTSDVNIISAPSVARVQAPDKTLTSAKLISPSLRIDPRIQGRSFFYLVSAQISGFLPGMNIVAYLPTGPMAQGFIVPSSAVIWWQGKTWVYIQKGTDRFIRHEISTNTPAKDGWFVEGSFSAGELVVVRGVQLLLSEEFRSQIQVGEEEGSK